MTPGERATAACNEILRPDKPMGPNEIHAFLSGLFHDAAVVERNACVREAEDERTNWEEPGSGWAACTTIANRIRARNLDDLARIDQELGRYDE